MKPKSWCRPALFVLCLWIITSRAVAALPTNITFLSDFAAYPLIGKWGYIEVVSRDRLSGKAGYLTSHGKRAAVVDVRPGDNPMSCCAYSERAEVAHMKSESGLIMYESEASGTQYFAVSYKFPADFQAVQSTRWGGFQIILQLHGPNSLGAPPVLALDIANNAYKIRSNGGDMRNGNRYVTQQFFDSSLNLGRWTDLIIRIKFAKDNTGRVTVWRRNELESQFRGVVDMNYIPTLQYNSERNIPPTKHYWKQGLYRTTAKFRNTFWMGPTARGTSFSAVERAAFGTDSGMAQQISDH